MANAEALRIEVVYALPGMQHLVSLNLGVNATAREAVQRSGLSKKFPEIETDGCALGIYGVRITLDHVLRDGDRVEIYRPLQADPKQARRDRVNRSRVLAKQARPK